jgi:hypothetical protein
MQKQALTAAAILCLVGGISGSNAVAKDQIPWSHLLTIADQTLQVPAFGSPLRTFTPVTPENLTKELRDDRFVADQFRPTYLIFPDGAQKTRPAGTHTVVRVIRVHPVLQAYALPKEDRPVDSDAANSIPSFVEGGVDLADYRLLFNRRPIKEWEK